jgi:hypothetical protein
MLHEDVDLLLPSDHFIDLGDVLMHQSLLEEDLSLDGLHLLWIALIHPQYFHCHCLSRRLVDGPPHPPVTAFSDLLS